MSKQSRDQQKLGKFYDFSITPEKLTVAQTRARNVVFRHFRNAFLFGFAIELMIIRTRICKGAWVWALTT